jgi:nitrogen regulatory protein PII
VSQYITSPQKLITVILPKGRDKELVHKLVDELGIQSVNVNFARGLGRITPLRHRGVGETTEKSIVTVLVDEQRADEVFEYIFYEADINRPHGGLMFQQPLLASTAFKLPDLEEED